MEPLPKTIDCLQKLTDRELDIIANRRSSTVRKNQSAKLTDRLQTEN